MSWAISLLVRPSRMRTQSRISCRVKSGHLSNSSRRKVGCVVKKFASKPFQSSALFDSDLSFRSILSIAGSVLLDSRTMTSRSRWRSESILDCATNCAPRRANSRSDCSRYSRSRARRSASLCEAWFTGCVTIGSWDKLAIAMSAQHGVQASCPTESPSD